MGSKITKILLIIKNNQIPDNDLCKTNYQDYIDEGQFTINDLRQKITNMKIHPYNTIGRITSKKQYIHQGILKIAQGNGIGCLIHPKIVLTVAHVIYFGMLGIHSGTAENIQFLHLNQKKTIKVKQCKFNQKYLSKNSLDTEIYDVAILILEEEADINENQVMIMDDSHNFSNTQMEIINVLTLQKDSLSNELNLYEQKNIIQKFTPSKLFYLHTTKGGDSGGPILINSNNGHSLIGIHKARSIKSNFGLIVQALLKQNQFLEQIRNQYKIKTKQELLQTHKQITIKLDLQQKNKSNPQSTLIESTKFFYNSNTRWKKYPKIEQTSIVQKMNQMFKKILKIASTSIVLKTSQMFKKVLKIESTSIVQKKSQMFQKVLKDPSQFCFQRKDYEKLFFVQSQFQKNRKGKFIDLNLNNGQFKMDVKDFYEYDWSQLQTLSLRDCLKSIQNLKFFFKMSLWLPSLQSLYISFMYKQFGDSGIYELVECKKAGSFKQLVYLKLSKNQITSHGLRHFAQNAVQFNLLQGLNFQGNNIDEYGIINLSICANKLPKLKQLDLTNCEIGFKEMKALAENGQKFKKIKKLNLDDNRIGDIQLSELCEQAHKFQNLSYLNLTKNDIEGEGWRSLVKHGHSFVNLRQIYLNNNKITQIKEGDLNSFQNLNHINFGLCNYVTNKALQWSKNPLSSQTKEVLTKYQKEHPNVRVVFYQ